MLLDQGTALVRIRGRTFLHQFLKSEKSFFLTRYYPATGTGICAPGRGNFTLSWPYQMWIYAAHKDWRDRKGNPQRFTNTWDTGESLMIVGGYSYSLGHNGLNKFSQRLKPWSTKVRIIRDGLYWSSTMSKN